MKASEKVVETRKAINFDLKEEPLRKAIASGEAGFKRRGTAWEIIGRFFKKSGFEHDQKSGYVSENGISSARARVVIVRLGEAYPWLAECMTKCRLTSIESFTDLTADLKKGATQRQDKGLLPSSPAAYKAANDPHAGEELFAKIKEAEDSFATEPRISIDDLKSKLGV